jgi:hypothetical protein
VDIWLAYHPPYIECTRHLFDQAKPASTAIFLICFIFPFPQYDTSRSPAVESGHAVRPSPSAGQEICNDEVELRDRQQDLPRLRIPLLVAGHLGDHFVVGQDRRKVGPHLRAMVQKNLLLRKSLGNASGNSVLLN